MVGNLATGSARLAANVKEYGYVTTTLALPASNPEADDYARDIDGDGDRDNRLGQLFAAFAQQGGDLRAALDAAIDRGDLLMLHSLRTPSLEKTEKASWQVLYAEPTEEPDFSGSGSFTVASTGPSSKRLPAKIKDGHVKTAAGSIPLQLDLGNGIFALTLKKGKVFADCSKPSCSSGRINGAITAAQVDTRLIPELAELYSAIVAQDCPGPGPQSCADGSMGKSIQNLFDEDDDLVITEDELRESSLIQAVLAPDLDLVKANGNPGQDGVEDALSAGLGFEAVRARLVRP